MLGSAIASASPIQVMLLYISRATDIDQLIRFQRNIIKNVFSLSLGIDVTYDVPCTMQ